MKQLFLSILLFALIGSTFRFCVAEQDPALLPAQILKPVPPKYADHLRLFQGIPSMTVAPNGRLWAAWYTGDTGEGSDNIVTLVSSGNAGKTWTPPLLAIDQPGASVRIYDPSIWTDPEGNVWLFWAQCRSKGLWDTWDGRSGTWTMVTKNPNDENAEWSTPQRISDGIMMCKPIADSKGRWLLPVSVWNIEPDHPDRTLPPGAHVIVSEDKGQTWTPLGHSTVPRKDALYDEHNIVEMKEGTFWMLHRTKNGIAESFSRDGGKTWTEPKPSQLAHPSARFFVRRLQSGHLLLVKHGALDEKTERSHLQAFLSDDDGKTWKGGLMLDERINVSYPDGDQDKNGTIYVIYDRERQKDKEILMARFTEEDVLTGKIVSAQGALRQLVNKATGSPPPGAVVAISPDFQKIFPGSPSITILPDGSIIAAHDFWGKRTDIFRSEKRGNRWRPWMRWSEIPGRYASVFFVHENSLYSLGTIRGGDWGIQRSDDGGKTWTEARDSQSGLLLKGKYHSCSNPVLIHQGRLWVTLEQMRDLNEGETSADWARRFMAMMASVPLDADWMNAENWTFSNPLPFPFEHWQELGWLEGNPLVDPNGKVVNVIRVELDGADKAAILNCSDDGKTLSVDPKNGLIDLPGGSTKFAIRYDEKTKKYWTISNPQKSPSMKRNVLALACSEDLRSWEIRSILLRHYDRRNHAWQYIDWVFDGEDIVFVSRTAWDGSRSWHDVNYITFHRVERFRERTRQDDAAWLGDYVSTSYETEQWKIEILGPKEGKPEIGIFQNGERVFTNRKHLWRNIPEQYQGYLFTRGGAAQTTIIHATAKESGEMIIVHEDVAEKNAYRFRQWTPMTTPPCYYTESENSKLVFSSRKVEKGETILLPLADNFVGEIFIFKE